MDPQETLRLMLTAQTAAEAEEYGAYLAEWLRKGGFAPHVPKGTKYWPGTNTPYALLSPLKGGDIWTFVHYDRRGNVRETWPLEEV